MQPEILIDGLNVFMRHYCANPTVSLHNTQCGGILGFLRNIQHLCDRFRPHKMTIVWEGGGSSRRRAIEPNYKLGKRPVKLNRSGYYADRYDTKDNRDDQLKTLIEILKFIPVTQIYVNDCEADDIIGYICRNKKDDRRKIIVTSDKDYYQLLDDSTVVMRPTQKEILTKYDVTEKYNIHPNNFPIARAIEGDSSDNLKGVKGLGIKTVSKLFTRLKNEDFFELKDVFKICEEKVKNEKNCGKSIHKILENKELIEENYVLMQLQVTRISVQNQNVIHSIVEHNDSDFNQIFFLSELINCGLGKNNEYEELKKNCRILSNKNWEV